MGRRRLDYWGNPARLQGRRRWCVCRPNDSTPTSANLRPETPDAAREGAPPTADLPTEISDALHIAEGDELDAELVEDGVLLKPRGETRRRAALDLIHQAQAGVRYISARNHPLD